MQLTALGVASEPVRAAGARAAAPAAADTTKWFPGFKPFKVKTTGAEINGVIGGQGPPVLLLHGAPQTHITWRMVAPKLAATRTVVAHRPSRLRRQQQAAGRRDARQLLEARDGARSGRGDEALRLRQVPGHRPGPRRPRHASHGARSRRQGDARRGARHHPDLLPLHARGHQVRPGLLPLVQLPARRAGARERAARPRPTRRRRRRRARFSSSTCARRAIPRTSTRCARTIAPARRSI